MADFPPVEEDFTGKCLQCRFWEPNLYDRRGLCRISPPQTFKDKDGNMQSGWPETKDKDWCGQFVQGDSREAFKDSAANPE
jgi:hypothetical protein